MSSPRFYSRKRQFFREWRVLWRMHKLDTLLGGVYVLSGFYAAHQVGISQVHNVITPFMIASIVAGYLAVVIYAPQSRGNTLPFYFNLPRNRTAAWDAHLAYLIGSIVWMEGVILIGVMFKLGGAGMTPHYRLHPEAFCLPFVAIASAASYAHFRHAKNYLAAIMVAVTAFVVGLYYWLVIGFPEDAGTLNNFFPPRGFSLSSQYAIAALLLLSAAFVLALSRLHWQAREVGEIE